MNNGNAGFESDTPRETQRQEKRKFRIVDIVAYLICLLLAIGIWVYVIGTESEEYEYTFTDVVVRVEGTSELERNQGLSVVKEYSTRVNVTVKGYRSEIMKYTAEDLFAYINVGSISDTGIHSLNITAELPVGKLNLVSVSPASVNVFVDETTSKNIPLKIDLRYNIADSYTLHDPIPEFETVEISGPKTTLDNISCAKVVYDLGTVKTSTNFKAAIKLYDDENNEVDNPYVKLGVSEMMVKIKVTTEKELALVPKYSGLEPDKYDYSVVLTPKTVTVEGDPALIEALDAVEVVLGEVSQSLSGSITVGSAIKLPAGVTVKGTDIIRYQITKTPKPSDAESDE